MIEKMSLRPSYNEDIYVGQDGMHYVWNQNDMKFVRHPEIKYAYKNGSVITQRTGKNHSLIEEKKPSVGHAQSTAYRVKTPDGKGIYKNADKAAEYLGLTKKIADCVYENPFDVGYLVWNAAKHEFISFFAETDDISKHQQDIDDIKNGKGERFKTFSF